MTKLSDLLSETRGVGFEEFLETMEAAIEAETAPEVQRMLRFARAFLISLIETARKEAGEEPGFEEWTAIVMDAFSGVAWAFPCFVATGIKAGHTGEAIEVLLRESFTPVLREVAQFYDAEK